MKPATILFIDDHKLIREVWMTIFSADERYIVVGETGNGEEALEIVMQKNPDIVLCDINIYPDNGISITRKILEQSPHTAIIGVSVYDEPEVVKEMFRAGAKGYVTKTSCLSELKHAIDIVVSGESYVCSEIKDIISQHLLLDSAEIQQQRLSGRELEVIKGIKQGLSSGEIAKLLGLSQKTIEVHRYNILKKLQLKNTASLINYVNQKWI